MRKIVYVLIVLLLGFFIWSHSAEIMGVDDSYTYINEGDGYDNISDYYPVDESPSIEEIPVESQKADDDSESYYYSDGYSSSGSNSYESEPVEGGSYVASANSDKFHTPYCGSAERIKQANRIYFSSRDEALASGYAPCKKCNP